MLGLATAWFATGVAIGTPSAEVTAEESRARSAETRRCVAAVDDRGERLGHRCVIPCIAYADRALIASLRLIYVMKETSSGQRPERTPTRG